MSGFDQAQTFKEEEHSLIFAYDSSNNLLYIGEAPHASSTANPVWQIKKLNYDSSNNLTSIQFAGGLPYYAFIWDNRASLSYS